MRIARKLGLGGAIIVGALAGFSSTAGAKYLPVTSITIATAHPVAGQPVDVVVRFNDDFTLGNAFAVTNAEIVALPSERADASGFPLDRNESGIPVLIHSVSNAEFRGSFVAPTSGSYVVFSRSSMYAREGLAAGENITRSYPQPVRITVTDPVAQPTARPSQSSTSSVSFLEIGRWILIVLAFVSIFGALMVKHRAVRALREVARDHDRGSPAPDHSSAS